MYGLLFLFLLLVAAADRTGNEMTFSLILCGSSFQPVAHFAFLQHLICPSPLHWQKRRGKGISERELCLLNIFHVLTCCTMAIHRLLSLWLVLDDVQLYGIVLHFAEVLLLTAVQKQQREAPPGAESLCSAECAREPRSAEAKALPAASAFLNTP